MIGNILNRWRQKKLPTNLPESGFSNNDCLLASTTILTHVVRGVEPVWDTQTVHDTAEDIFYDLDLPYRKWWAFMSEALGREVRDVMYLVWRRLGMLQFHEMDYRENRSLSGAGMLLLRGGNPLGHAVAYAHGLVSDPALPTPIWEDPKEVYARHDMTPARVVAIEG